MRVSSGAFFYRTTCVKTTWLFKGAVLLFLLLGVSVTRPWWEEGIGRELICNPDYTPSDALLLENFDPTYQVFERAAALRRAGIAKRIVVPLGVAPHGGVDTVRRGVAELMAGVANLGSFETVPIPEEEPISLNAALALAVYLQQTQTRSVTIVTPLFRSKRSMLAYSSAFEPLGITGRCVPVEG
jgi:hypothetical protein